MYSPIKDGVDKSAREVSYSVATPAARLSRWVHCYWELKTVSPLTEDFLLHAVPDACVNLLFNQIDTRIAAVTALRTRSETLNLGRNFHYVGIELLPGVWRGDQNEIARSFVGSPYEGCLPLIETSAALSKVSFVSKQSIMADLVDLLINQSLVVPNPVTEAILQHLTTVNSVAEMAALVGLSPRQLQRSIKQSTGFSPHDLLKVLRLQQSFKQHYLDLYADQSHYIHSFKSLTGYTPGSYGDKFNV
jgi:AraC-like DNA-binding protein